MIRYENTGFKELDAAIEKLCSDSEEDLDQCPREQIVIVRRGDLLITSYYSIESKGWIVHVGSYSNLERIYFSIWNQDVENEIEKPGLQWIHSEYLGNITSDNEEAWLVKELGIPREEYNDNMWTRRLAVEYALTRI